jgi:tRNA modification GTPase
MAGRLPGAIVLPAPRTYTREDVVEIHVPGSPPGIDRLVRDLVERGARPARPGEFTLRAFLNGRLDLAQAEAVGQLISSEGDEDRRAALGQLAGRFSSRVRRVEGAVLDLCADAEAAIDFIDQDIEILPVAEAVGRAGRALRDLRDLLRETAAAAVADHRPEVVLYGRPNSGKSALFNALAGTDAIVSPVAGTTRDVRAADVDVGLPVRLVDTAGDQVADGPDAEAVRRGRAAMGAADVVLFVVDATDWEPSVALEPRGVPVVLVINKRDLVSGRDVRAGFHVREAVCVSARTGEGLDRLREVLAGLLGGSDSEGGGARFRVSLRQDALLREAGAALERAASTATGLGMEFVSLDLRAALEALGGITGRQVGEDLLDRIFSRFCLGK